MITALLLAAVQQPETPVMIDISPPANSDPTGLSDVLLGALGLTGVLILCAVVLAALFAGALLVWRWRTGLDVNPDETRDQHII